MKKLYHSPSHFPQHFLQNLLQDFPQNFPTKFPAGFSHNISCKISCRIGLLIIKVPKCSHHPFPKSHGNPKSMNKLTLMSQQKKLQWKERQYSQHHSEFPTHKNLSTKPAHRTTPMIKYKILYDFECLAIFVIDFKK